MDLDFETRDLLQNDDAKRVFKEIARNRRANFNDLTSLAPRDRLQTTLSNLVSSSLIAKQPSFIDDFSTYYVTSKGLEVMRELNE
jgi:hypothetical protein